MLSVYHIGLELTIGRSFSVGNSFGEKQKTASCNTIWEFITQNGDNLVLRLKTHFMDINLQNNGWTALEILDKYKLLSR